MQLGGRKGIRPVKTWGGYGCYRSSASYRTRKVPIQDNNNHHLTVREQRDEWPETAIQNLPNPMRTNGEPDLVIQCFLMPTPLNCSDWAYFFGCAAFTEPISTPEKLTPVIMMTAA